MTINPKDIESELSYIYLHAVASLAGFTCSLPTRLEDNHGIDVTIRNSDKLAPDSKIYDFSVDIQLKATIKQLEIINNKIAYSFRGIKQYDKLRSEFAGNPKIVILLMLPENKEEWLHITKEQLVLKNAAYWVSLYRAPESENTTSQTIYIPTNNLLTVTSLKEMMIKISIEENIKYEQL
ncbi:DUF4365 domain-containing protein (plasmid) [Silvanigrella paludirubra]|uniref:DUF4365 domain-containing protein n=1 Tax=Silvanigrella paludirubra TaxID=2499159 RepID=A0A6N6VMI2_9BACT|nr:DUF4365 domain-containing protein [Silvanigrella paludirubra]KAB8035634.1 DUF4365 domain-containing protein [Silvanigrella paludirubra]